MERNKVFSQVSHKEVYETTNYSLSSIANYVEVLEEAPAAPAPPAAPVAPQAPQAPQAPSAPPAPPQPPVAEEGPKAVALYDYDAGEDNEITFREGQTITDIEFVSDDWWQGASGGRLGLFPGKKWIILVFILLLLNPSL
jgi:hypothetical protein